MKRFLLFVFVAAIASGVFAKSWRKESMTEGTGYVYFNHAIVYNDSSTKFEANYVPMEPVSVLEFNDTYINLSGLKNFGLRIYYDLIPLEKTIIIHVADDKGVEG